VLKATAALGFSSPLKSFSFDSENRYELAAKDAVKWLRAQSITTGAGKAWPAVPGKKETLAVDLYSGTAGVALLLAEAGQRWKSQEILEDARQAGKETASWFEQLAENRFFGLYTGLAGCFWALSKVQECGAAETSWQSKDSPDLAYLYAADIAAKHEALGTNDVIAGLAGIGLAFLEKPLAKNPKVHLGAACGIGDHLIARAKKEEGGLRWALDETYGRNMPNFSHGTAGVAFFLAKLYVATKQKPYLEHAIGGAEYLKSIANKENDGCLIYHADPDGLARYYLGWCHGPAGTSQLWWQLQKATGKSEWREWAVRSAKSMMDLGVPEKRTEGYWNNEGLCCGTAGIGRFFLDMYRRTNDAKYLGKAKQCADVILKSATKDEQGARWTFAEHRVKPDETSAQTGWMQGAAGIAAFLMEMSSPRKAVFRLPVDAN
jgi:lantibiotic modifying enzyme